MSFLYTLYGQVSGKKSEVAIETVDFGFLDSYNMWLMKVKESQQFQYFASYSIDIHANEFQPTNKAVFICTTYFQFPSLPVHQRRNQRS